MVPGVIGLAVKYDMIPRYSVEPLSRSPVGNAGIVGRVRSGLPST